MIRYVERGDIRDDPSDVLVVTVNCIPGVLGAGQAKAFAERWPWIVERHRSLCRTGHVRIGNVCLTDVEHDLSKPNTTWPTIALFPTKQHWKAPSRLEWVADGLRDMVRKIKKCDAMGLAPRSYALPALGCGLGGLSWEQVRPLIELAELRTPDTQWTIYLPGAERIKR